MHRLGRGEAAGAHGPREGRAPLRTLRSHHRPVRVHDAASSRYLSHSPCNPNRRALPPRRGAINTRLTPCALPLRTILRHARGVAPVMTDDEFLALLGSPHEQLAHAQACLDLFEKDWGRRAISALDLRQWADLQGADSLRFRIGRRVRTDQAWTKACHSIWQNVPAPLASRPPLGQRICLTLAQAAQLTGESESALLAAIRQGRIAAVKDVFGHWYIERAELARAYPPPPAPARAPDGTLDPVTLLAELGLSAVVPQASEGAAHLARQPAILRSARCGP